MSAYVGKLVVGEWETVFVLCGENRQRDLHILVNGYFVVNCSYAYHVAFSGDVPAVATHLLHVIWNSSTSRIGAMWRDGCVLGVTAQVVAVWVPALGQSPVDLDCVD